MIDKKIVDLVIKRAGGYCEYCGFSAEETMALHHRKLKSRGGKDTVENLVWLHHGCHNLKSNSVHLRPEISQKLGFMVHSWDDPKDVPLVRADGALVLLQSDGTITLITEAKNESDNHSR